MSINLSILIMMATTVFSSSKSENTKHSFEYTIQTTASPETIWHIWTDVAQWHQWDTGLKSATLKGKFQLGAKGKLTPDKGPKANFKITAIHEGKSYTFRTGLPLGGLYVERYLNTQNGITSFTHRVSFKGLGGRLLSGSLGKRYKAMLPEVMNKIKQIAEQKE